MLWRGYHYRSTTARASNSALHISSMISIWEQVPGHLVLFGDCFQKYYEQAVILEAGRSPQIEQSRIMAMPLGSDDKENLTSIA